MLGRRIAWMALLSGLTACDAGVRLGTPCTYTSECAAPLACVFGRCREECAGARDCEAWAECLQTPSGLAACSIPADDRCERDDQCASGLRCVEGVCRQTCATGGCAPDMTCEGEICARIDAPAVDAGATDAGTCAGDPCDPVAGCGCAAGQRCAVVADALACVAEGGTAAYGEPCGTSAECVAGHGCHAGRCLEYCRSYQDCGAGGVVCGDVIGVSGLPNGLDVCSEPCDPIADSGCAEGSCSVIIGAEGVPFTYCRSLGTAAIEASCFVSHDCVAGAVCDLEDPGGSARICYAFCDPAAGPCPGAQPCEAYQTIRGQAIGVCRP